MLYTDNYDANQKLSDETNNKNESGLRKVIQLSFFVMTMNQARALALAFGECPSIG